MGGIKSAVRRNVVDDGGDDGAVDGVVSSCAHSWQCLGWTMTTATITRKKKDISFAQESYKYSSTT